MDRIIGWPCAFRDWRALQIVKRQTPIVQAGGTPAPTGTDPTVHADSGPIWITPQSLQDNAAEYA